MDPLFLAANLLFLSTYLVNDLLRCRALSGLGTLCLVAYFALQAEPMMNVVAWNLVFLALTAFQIGRLLLARGGRSGSLPA
jgi:hypothetical protein